APSSARVSPPGPGPISIVVPAARFPAARAILAVRLRSSRKCWPRPCLAPRPCRAMTSRSGGRSTLGTPVRRLPAHGHGGGHLERCHEALRARDTLAGNIERGAVIGRGANEW